MAERDTGPEPEILGPAEVAAIEAGFAGLVPLDGPGDLKALDIGMNGGEFLLGDYRSTRSGVSINTRTAMEISAVQACVAVVAEDVGKLPLQLFSWDSRRGVEKAIGHAYYKLLAEAANGDMSSQTFRETLTAHAMLTGNGYGWKAMDAAGQVKELWPLLPGSCMPRRDARNFGELYYDVWFEDGSHESVPADRIFRLTGLSWDGISGLNRVALGREILGLSTRLTQAQARFYGKDQRPSGVLSTEKEMAGKAGAELIDRIKATWQKQFGPDGDGGVAIVDGGFKFEAMSVSAKDADSIALWRFLIEEACRIFRVQPLKVMHATGTQSYASVEMLNQAHLTDTLDPWLVRWESSFNRDVLAGERKQQLYCKFNRNAVVRPLPKDRYAIYQTARQASIMSVNEIRELEEMAPVEGGHSVFAQLATNPTAHLTPKPAAAGDGAPQPMTPEAGTSRTA